MQCVRTIEIACGWQRNRQIADVAAGLDGHIAADAHDALIEAAEIDIPGYVRIGRVGQQPRHPELAEESTGIAAEARGQADIGSATGIAGSQSIDDILKADD